MQINPSTDSSSIIASYLRITGLYTLSASIIWGVNTLFLLNAGLELFEVFLVNAVFTASMAIFEIPTGVLADTRGRRLSFLLSISILFLGTLGYVAVAQSVSSVFGFAVMSVILGLGFTFYSGALEAWLVDALSAAGFQAQLDTVFARAAMVSGGAMLVGSIGGGLLGELNLAIPYLVRSGLLVLVFGFSFFTVWDLGFTPANTSWRNLPKNMQSITKASITHGWKEEQVRLLLLSGVFQALMGAWGFYAWQPYFLGLLGRNLTWVSGVIAALISLSSIAGNSLVEWLSRFCGRRTTLLIGAAAISTAALIGVGLANSFWLAVCLYLVAMGATGVTMPVKQAYLHQITPAQQRATVISFDSLLASAGSVVGQSGLGYLSQERSLSLGYITGGLTTVFALPFLVKLRQMNQLADYITGRAGKSGICPAQGLPEVSTLDTDAGVMLE